MPGRYIDLVLPKRNLVARAALFDAEAPRTCELLWRRLPISAPAIHAMFSCCELFVTFPWDGEAPPQENYTACTDAGDLFFYYAPWYGDGVAPSGEIAIFYDRDAIPIGGNGLMAGVLFASIVENRDAFAAAAEAIWREGTETLIIQRSEGR